MSMRLIVRRLTHSPWFTAAAICTIALGIGTNVAIFTIVNHVLFRPLPFEDPDRLVWISSWNADRGQYSKSSGYDFHLWVQRSELFESVELFWDRAYTLRTENQSEALVGWQFTPGLITMLGTRPALGRTFAPEEGRAGREAVTIISDNLWRRRFDARPDIVGKTIELDGQQYEVAGVMPPTFAHPYASAQLWTPLAVSTSMLDDRRQRPFRAIARLKNGVSRERAEAELRAINDRVAREHPDTHAGWSVRVRPLRDFYVADAGSLLWILQGTALILLLIAASNVAGLVLVRATGREKEVAVRLALGASRTSLLKQYVAEGLTLALVGAGCGLVLAFWGMEILPQLLATRLRGLQLPQSPAGWFDIRVLLATALATAAIGLLFGVTPLLRRAGTLGSALAATSRSSTGDRRTRFFRHAIVALQVALSVSLLVGAGLLLRSFARLQERTFGFNTKGIVTAQLNLPRDHFGSPAQTSAFLERLATDVAALPGVQSAALINTLPLTGFNALRPYGLPGRPQEDRFAEFRIVTPDYFRTMQIPIRRGRAFDTRDRLGAANVVIVNETVARRLWPAADPVGQVIVAPDMLDPSPKTVVGVVGDTRHHDLAKDPEPEIYRPALQVWWPFFGLVVRTPLSTDRLERPIREAAGRIDRAVPMSAFQPLEDLADSTMAWRRGSMTMLALFAGAACFLSFVGVYGVMAYSVTERTREIGVRLALGARPRDVARAVLRQGAGLTAIGIAVGLTLSAFFARVLSALLFGVDPIDPATFATVTVVAIAAGLVASALPAAFASRTDPTVALRGES
jgi:putative ABC transport system permease protein